VINHSLRDVIVDLKAEVDDCLDAKPIE